MKVKEKLSDWRYRLSKVWLFDRLETTYYRLKYGLFNFYLLGPVIWSFRTWDYAYFLNVMITMLEQMERHHRDYGACVDHHRTAKQIRTAKILCQWSPAHQRDSFRPAGASLVSAIRRPFPARGLG